MRYGQIFALALATIPVTAEAALINSGSISLGAFPNQLFLQFEAYDLGGGQFRYDVGVDDPNDVFSSYFLDAFGVTGNIDSVVFYSPFKDILIGPGITNSPDPNGGPSSTVAITASSGPGSKFDTAAIAQVYAHDNSIVISGSVNKGGRTHLPFPNNIMWAPEPSTFVLAGIGGLALLAHVFGRRLSTRC